MKAKLLNRKQQNELLVLKFGNINTPQGKQYGIIVQDDFNLCKTFISYGNYELVE